MGTLNVEFNVAVAPTEATTTTTSLTQMKDSTVQLASLTSSINSELASNIGAAAVVTGATVQEVKAVVEPTAAPATPAPTTAPATPAPTTPVPATPAPTAAPAPATPAPTTAPKDIA